MSETSRPANVAQFKRPDLDEEMVTCLEQLEEAEQWLRFYLGQRADISKVRGSLGSRAKPHLLEMLDTELASLSGTIEYIETVVSGWKEILEVLKARAARS